MLKAAVVEDDKRSQEQFQTYLRKYGEENGEQFEITIYDDGLDILDDYKLQFDLIFCDIQMKMLNGMETARKIRSMDRDVLIIFITNLPEYAIQGYEVSAVGYLLKPVNYVSFSMYLSKSLNLIRSRKSEYLVLSSNGGIQRIELSNLYYIACQGHYLDIYTKTGTIRILMPMKDIEKKLDGKNFSRCNSGYLVNLMHVVKVDKNMVTVGMKELVISRPRKKEFMKDLTDYLGGEH